MTGSLSDDTAQGPDTDDAVLRNAVAILHVGTCALGKEKACHRLFLGIKRKGWESRNLIAAWDREQ